MMPLPACRNSLQPNKFTAISEEHAVGDFHGFGSGGDPACPCATCGTFWPVSTSQTCATMKPTATDVSGGIGRPIST